VNEPALAVLLAAYLLLYVLLVSRAHGSPVSWLSSVLCLAPAPYISWSIFGAAHDMDLVIELVESARQRTSPWLVAHGFNHLPGFPILLTPIGWMSASASPGAIATKVTLLNLGFLIWSGWIAGRVAFPDTSDSSSRSRPWPSCCSRWRTGSRRTRARASGEGSAMALA
jgi:hypothetical protein